MEPQQATKKRFQCFKTSLFTIIGFHLLIGTVTTVVLCYFIVTLIIFDGSSALNETVKRIDHVSEDADNRIYHTFFGGESQAIKLTPLDVAHLMMTCSATVVVFSIINLWCLINIVLKHQKQKRLYRILAMVTAHVCGIVYIWFASYTYARLQNLSVEMTFALTGLISILLAWLLATQKPSYWEHES